MITACITTKQGNVHHVQISGHATYRSCESYSQICLAVSFLARTIMRFLEQQECIDDIDIRDGFLAWQIQDASSNTVAVAMDILLLGLHDLYDQWPMHLTILLQEE